MRQHQNSSPGTEKFLESKSNRGYLFSIKILIALVALVPASLWSADRVKLATADKVAVITGGSSGHPWKIRYALGSANEVHLAVADARQAYFSHGPWLRLIDTQRGVVTGRWFLPGSITKIEPVEGQVKLEITRHTTDKPFKTDLLFDPDHPHIPFWGNESVLAYRLSEREATNLFLRNYSNNLYQPVDANGARTLIPEIREAINRDPISPWFHVVLGKILLDSRDPEATAAFEDAIRTAPDYTELLPLSAFFENCQLPQLADKAYERGYGDFLQSDNDPRLADGVLRRLVLYPVAQDKVASERRDVVKEHIFQIAPYSEDADLGWTLNARSASAAQNRTMWAQRAQEARERSSYRFSLPTLAFDVGLLIIVATIFAKWLFVITQYVRYRPQRLSDKKAFKLTPVPRRKRIVFFNVQYWSIWQRIGYALIFVIAWFSWGWGVQALRSVMQYTPIAIANGTFAAPEASEFLQSLAATSERDFLLALSAQQNGDRESAVRFYQKAAQYAESWNNLGVIWSLEGKAAEARQAFERALQLKPTLAEAALNLGQPVPDYWTKLHQQYVPGRPMFATLPPHMMMRALNGSLNQRFLHAWTAPVKPLRLDDAVKEVSPEWKEPETAGIIVSALLQFAFFVVILLFLLPRLPVERPAGPIGNTLAVLLPGTVRQWGVIGPAVLLAWMFSLAQLFMLRMFGSPYITTYIATPNLSRMYWTTGDQWALINPGWTTLYLAPAVLFLLNLWVVVNAIRKSRQVAVKVATA